MRRFLVLLLASCTPTIDLQAPGLAPEADVFTPTEAARMAAGPAAFTGVVRDPQDPPERLFAVWSARAVDGWRDLCSGFGEPDGTTRCAATVAVGDDAVRLRVTDLAGYRRDVVVPIEVFAGSAPVVSLTGPRAVDPPVYEGRGVPFVALVRDDDHPPSTWQLRWESASQGALDGPVAAGADGRIEGALPLRRGSHRVTLTVTDPDGLVGQDRVDVIVQPPNQVPSCRLDAPREGAVQAVGSPWTVSGRVVDPEWPPGLTVSVRSDVDGVVGTGAPDDLGIVAIDVPLSRGAHALRLEAEDHVGGACAASVTVLVDDPPALRLDDPAGPVIVAAGAGIDVAATLSHPVHPAQALRLSVSSAGTWAGTTLAPDASGSVSARLQLPVGSHVLTFEAVDPNGLRSAPRTREVAVGAP